VERARVAVGLATTAFLNSFGADKVVGASGPQMLLGVGRPGLSRGVIEDVRDALQSSAWYMRYEGGRYRFTTEPNLNKVIIEREGAIGDDRIIELLNGALGKVAPQAAPWRVEYRVDESSHLPDEARLVLGVLDYDHTIGTGTTKTTVVHAQTVLTQRGPAGRTNKNAAVLVAADAAALPKARSTARTLAAMRGLKSDTHRLKRFNEEQREALEARIAAHEERLPAQVVMAYRHLLLLGFDRNNNGMKVDNIDLGPAKVNDTVTERVTDYLRSADRLLDGLAPAALLSERFALLGTGEQAVELEPLLASFYRLPRLPRLTSTEVLRTCLVKGVEQGVFGLSSGSKWDADDAVVRFKTRVDPGEVQFQPGTWLVRAAAAGELLERQSAATTTAPSTDPGTTPAPAPQPGTTAVPATAPVPAPAPSAAKHVTITVTGVPPDKAREVVKVAVLPLAANGADVNVSFTVVASASGGIPGETLDLVVREGLRQLGVDHDVAVE
jgi:hypothetical protein